MNKRLNKCIKGFEKEKYSGTPFRRELFKKFGVPIQKKDREDAKQAQSKLQSEEEKNGPFADFGFGIQAWIRSLFFLFKVYVVLSCIALLIMKSYHKFHGLETHKSGFAHLTQFSLGNIGFAQSECYF